jgi:hypothetical protein
LFAADRFGDVVHRGEEVAFNTGAPHERRYRLFFVAGQRCGLRAAEPQVAHRSERLGGELSLAMRNTKRARWQGLTGRGQLD